jgi:hypothetical protein
LGTNLPVYEIMRVPPGARRVARIMTFTTDDWPVAAIACTPNGLNDCTAGATSGSFDARYDVLCVGSQSVMAGPASSPTPTWPDSIMWDAYDLTRTSAGIPYGGGGAPLAGSANDYVPSIRQAPPGFDFVSLDTATVTHAWLSASTPLAMPNPPIVQRVTSASTYPANAGLRVTETIVDTDPRLPPSDADLVNCFDTPQDTIMRIDDMVTPAADGLYPRWAILISEPDIRDGSVTRILDWHCVVAGPPPGDPDTDGDCLTDSVEPMFPTCSVDPDCDNDLVPDGVEYHFGSNPMVADTDADGASDYDEIVQLTDPTNQDSDGDGSKDRRDTGADEDGGTPLTVSDTTNDDNCPAIYNPGQQNEDDKNEFHGGGPETGDRTNPTGSPAPFGTNPDGDELGDACDLDDDNDDITDRAETAMTIT